MTRLHLLRRLSQIAFVALIFFAPVFDIFRFDSASGTIIFFGNEWGLGLDPDVYLNPSTGHSGEVAWHIFTKALLPWIIILSIFPLLGTLLGRFFCGWFCPEGAMFELFDFLSLRILGRRNLFMKSPNDPAVTVQHRLPYLLIASFCIITIPLLSGVMLTGYFVAPSTIWKQIFSWDFTFGVKAGIIGVSIYVLLSALVIRHVLCKYICGAGLIKPYSAGPVQFRYGLVRT
jgi:polyferredoxin